MGERAAGEGGGQAARLTVVIPVWNEGRNLRRWWLEAAPHLPPGTRVLVVYDFEEDDTLPVVAALASEGAPLVPVRNRQAGFPGAMLTGLRAAGPGPVLVAMGDVADDLGAIPRMLAAHAAGAELVVGSRYMPGGRTTGGPVLKGLLARWGSGALHGLAGLPVRDATNAFRLYDGALVARLRVEPCAGFEVVLAVLLAAWRARARIVEVPVAWQARRQGESRFRLAWIPRYGRLWLLALAHGLGARLGRAGGRDRAR